MANFRLNKDVKRAGLIMIFIPTMLIFGTATVVTQKILFGMEGNGLNHDRHKFDKPWFQTNSMFIGMFICLVVYEILNVAQLIIKIVVKVGFTNEQPAYAEQADEDTPLSDEQKSDGEEELVFTDLLKDGDYKRAAIVFLKHLRTYIYVLAPAMCDLVATAMMNIGLLWIPASIWQMLRGSMVIFTAIMSIIFLGRRLYSFNWVGICIVVSALVIVGISSVLMPPPPGESDANSDTLHVIIGVLLVVAAQLVQASQIVIEEFLLKSVKAPPLFIVGLEGLWGMIVCCLVCLPIVYIIPFKGIHEDSIDTVIMFFTTPQIFLTGLWYMFAIFGYNFGGMMVTQLFTAVHRTILEAVRTACIWVVNVFICYMFVVFNKEPTMGERITVWSSLELFGFILLSLGSLIYNRVIELPGLYYPPAQDFSKIGNASKDDASGDVDS